jgi:hypothetical protein
MSKNTKSKTKKKRDQNSTDELSEQLVTIIMWLLFGAALLAVLAPLLKDVTTFLQEAKKECVSVVVDIREKMDTLDEGLSGSGR